MRRGEESERGKKRGCDLPEEKKGVELVEREREREKVGMLCGFNFNFLGLCVFNFVFVF